jgi:hypothetical protein
MSHEMITNMAEALCPSIHTSRFEVDELGTKATPKTPPSVATNTTKLGLDCDGVGYLRYIVCHVMRSRVLLADRVLVEIAISLAS